MSVAPGESGSGSRPVAGACAGQAVLIVFAKVPRLGRVKTRLSPPFTLEEAVEFYSELLKDVLEVSASICREQGLEGILAVHPGEAWRELASFAPPGMRLVAQRGKNLSGRMSHAVAEAAAGGAQRILLRGSDCPVLDGDDVRRALQALEQRDIALCPDGGGGYCLVGLRAPAPGLFDHPMSTASVLSDTLRQAQALGLSTALLPESFDIDRAADLAALARVRSRIDTAVCKRALAYLDERDLWRHAV